MGPAREQGIEALQERYAIRHVYVFGFSQGGAYAYLVGIYHPDLVSGKVWTRPRRSVDFR
jgi:predicted esterase